MDQLCAWLQQARKTFPDHEVFAAWDDWSVYAHPKVLQQAATSRITIIWLPTYAPWLNPIEKLWRWMKQDVLHAHRLADRWEELKQRMVALLDQFADDSPPLLRYVGLLPD